MIVDMIKALPRVRGHRRLMYTVQRVFPRLKSWHGPVMVTRGGDWTNLATIFGLYGTGLSDLIRALPAQATYLDIGSNAGLFSLIAAKTLTDGRVIAVEPNPRVYRDLLANIALNHAANVLPLNVALGSETAWMTLAADPEHTGAGRLGAAEGERVATPVAVLDTAILAHLIGEARNPVLAKIDTEGFELRIMRALADCGLLRRIDQIWVEIDHDNLESFGDSEADIYALMAEHGFTPRIESPENPKHYDQHFVRGAD